MSVMSEYDFRRPSITENFHLEQIYLIGRKVEEGTKATKVPTSDFTIPFGCAWILVLAVLALVLWILRSLDLLLNELMGEVATG